MQHREVRNGDGFHPVDESSTTRMGMCHLAASKTSSPEAGGAPCPSQPAPSLGTLPRIRQGAPMSSLPGVVGHASPAIL